MLLWKRFPGQGVMLGEDVTVKVIRIEDEDGNRINDADLQVVLGFNSPPGVRVERLETFHQHSEPLPFPRFYRLTSRQSRSVQGYSLVLPTENYLGEMGYDYSEITSYEDMIEEDARVEIHIFRSEAEMLAFIGGVELTDIEQRIGITQARRDQIYLCLLHWYAEAYYPESNPVIRDKRLMKGLALGTAKRDVPAE